MHYLLKSRCNRFGVNSISEMLYASSQFTLQNNIYKINCPTLIIDNELEHLTKGQATLLFDDLNCKKEYIYFDATRGMGGHCQPLGRRQTLEIILGWLKTIY